MRLGELKAAIRKTKGNPQMVVNLGGQNITVGLMKTPLLDALDGAFPAGKTTETGITFDTETGLLFDEGGSAPAATTAPAPVRPAASGLLLSDDEPATAPVSTSLLLV